MKTPPFFGVTLVVFPSGPSSIFNYCIFQKQLFKVVLKRIDHFNLRFTKIQHFNGLSL